MEMTPARKIHERVYGFKVSEVGGITRVTDMYYMSPAVKFGLASGDEILAVNGQPVKADLNEWMEYFDGTEHVVRVNSGGILREIALKGDGQNWYSNPGVREIENPGEEKMRNYRIWAGK
jgi:predicted metalloprotease with PDZ domain